MIVEQTHMIPLPYYSEGPVVDLEGAVYCTTLSGGAILKACPGQPPLTWASSICPNGQYLLPNQDHLVCDSRQAAICRYSPDGRFMSYEVEGECGGQPLHVPNDLVADSYGGIYFTDSIRQEGKVGYMAPDGTGQIVASGLDYPNGIWLSPDHQKLFVAESYRNRVLLIPLRAPGVADAPPVVFAYLPVHASGVPEKNLPDGLALDRQGNLWVAHYGMGSLQVFNRQGQLIQTLEMPFPLVSNLCFHPQDPARLIVTGGYGEPGPGALLYITLKT